MVGIILINYKKYSDTIECLNSLANIDYDDYKIYVVDNCSENESVEVLKSYTSTKTILIPLNKNLGFAGGNNVAIKEAIKSGCEYILLLNNDTEVAVDFLSELVKYAANDKVCVPKIYYYNNPTLIWYAGGKINLKTGDTEHEGVGEQDGKQFSSLGSTQFATGCCILIPVNVIDDIGMIDEEYFMYYEDADYSVRINKAGYDIQYVPTAKIWHKVGSSTNGEYSKFTAYYMAKNRLKFIRKYGRKIDLYIAYVRTFLSGCKGILLNRNSKISFKALMDYFKE